MRGAPAFAGGLQCAAAGLYEYSIPRDANPSPAGRGCREPNRVRARGTRVRGIYMEPLVDGPAGSPILIHSITADNDRLNGPPSLDELCCASTPGILLRPRTSPSNLIQGGLGRAWVPRTFTTALSFSPLCIARRNGKREKKKNGNCPTIFFGIPRDDRPTNILPRYELPRLRRIFLSRSPPSRARALGEKDGGEEKKKKKIENAEPGVLRAFTDSRYTENVRRRELKQRAFGDARRLHEKNLSE